MNIQRPTSNVQHPTKQIVSRDQMRGIIAAGQHLVQRKYDGEFAVLECEYPRENIVLLGEHVTLKSGGFYTAADRALLDAYGEFFAAFRVASLGQDNFLAVSNRTAAGLLRGIATGFTGNLIMAETVQDVDACLAGGAEGVCAHPLAAVWGDMLAHKAGEIFTCRVRQAAGATQSVAIEDTATGECRGKVALRGGKCDQVRVGSIIRVEGMGLTEAGKIREPRACREWLVQY